MVPQRPMHAVPSGIGTHMHEWSWHTEPVLHEPHWYGVPQPSSFASHDPGGQTVSKGVGMHASLPLLPDDELDELLLAPPELLLEIAPLLDEEPPLAPELPLDEPASSG